MQFLTISDQEILERISRHSPDALSAYLQCVNRADEEGSVFFSRSLVEVDMSEDWRSFKSKIKKLARENLLEWHPFDDGISVTIVDFHDND